MGVIFSIVFFIVIFTLFTQSLGLKLFLKNGAFGPGFFPLSVSVILMLLILIYVLLYLKNRKKETGEEKSSTEIGIKQAFLIIGLFCAIFFVKYLGMLFVIGVFLFVTSVFVEKLSWKRSLIFSLVSITFIYLAFCEWLNFDLPSGSLFG